jgi:hypothetical protein
VVLDSEKLLQNTPNQAGMLFKKNISLKRIYYVIIHASIQENIASHTANMPE